MKKNAISSIAILCALFFNSSLSFSQSRQYVPDAPSANAQNLGLFGEIPISLNSGLPSISVPLYQINAKNITVPISLDYHASGVRQEVHPSWVGLGWSLNAGGAITRVVKGTEDEAYCNGCGSGQNKAGYYYSRSVNLRPEWKSLTYLQAYRYEDFVSDFEPDEFRFSFPGHSGSFFLDQEGKWRVRCDQPVKVIFDDDFMVPFSNTVNAGPMWNSPKTFKKFTIIDEHGVKYVFGNVGSADENSIEYSDQLINPDYYSSTATTWNLKQIISADGYDVVEFNYVRGPYQSNIYKIITNEQMCKNYFTPKFYTNGRLISTVYLSSITYAKAGLKLSFENDKSNELDYTAEDYNQLFNDNGIHGLSELLSASNEIPYFDANPPDKNRLSTWQWALVWLKLNTVNVSINNEKIKTINLKYDNTVTERLRLSEVEIKPSAGITSSQYYKFGYYEGKLPGYIRTLGDHWGFVNTFEMLSDRAYDPGRFYLQKSPASASDALVGTLKSIVYPTKGQTIFEYEQHKYAFAVNSSRTLDAVTEKAGGLRIRRIKNIDNTGNEEVKEYFYVKGYTPSSDVMLLPSSGILESEAKYVFNSGTLYDRSGEAFSFGFFSSNPIVPMTNSSSGQHIGYSEVVEKRSDGAYTIQKFTDYNNFPDNPPEQVWNTGMLYHVPVNSTSFERGRLAGKFVYNSAGKLIQSEEYEFTRPDNLSSQQLTSYSVRNIQVNFKNNCRDNALRTSVARVAYLMYYYPFLVKNITYKNYSGPLYKDSVISVKSFIYNNKGLAFSEKTTNSKGEVLDNQYNYAYANFPEMEEKNMLDYKSRITSSVGQKGINIQDIEYLEYPEMSDAPSRYYPKIVKQKVKSGDPDQTLIQFDNYKEGNILQQTIKGGTIESFQWGYNNNYPVAFVQNAANSLRTVVTKTIVKSATSVDLNPAGNRVPGSSTFKVSAAGPTTITIAPTGNPGIDTKAQVFVNIYGSTSYTNSITLCFGTGSQSCGTFASSWSGTIPAGNYTIVTGLSSGTSSNLLANVRVTLSAPTTLRTASTEGIKEFYFDGFEEGSAGVVGEAHTGRKYSTDTQVSWAAPSNGRTYVISYWYRTGKDWKFSGELSYNGVNHVMKGGDAYDDVRIHPIDAHMTTYTYDPLVGMTSSTDPKNETVHYGYDNFQRLMNIKDQDKNIIKYLDYHYKN